jgi:hypothetical protein
MLIEDLSEELNKRGLRYIWHGTEENSVGTT